MPPRPRFEPSPCPPLENIQSPPISDESNEWTPFIECSALFPVELFEAAVSQLIHHPEYNSTLILRSETVSELYSDFPVSIPRLPDRRVVRVIHRRLLPRRPGRDAGLEQYCTLYAPSDDDNLSAAVDTLILTPILTDAPLPYYHPSVHHIAFRYIEPNSTLTGTTLSPTLRIEAVPLQNTATDLNSRLYRTCLALLETLDRYGWGAMSNYKKRVAHDVLVPRDVYQDLYLVMRERHKHLVDTWQEVTDPLKHVFEDIGIATYLMLLWKETYSTSSLKKPNADESEPWKSWPRPPAGFLDLGCGNGLLTHILVAEGYDGSGVDLRARTSWSHYPSSTQSHLHVLTFDPTSATSRTDPARPDTSGHLAPFFKPGVFIIGNHADELTPWIPVLSTLHSASGYLSIPCCAWSFDCKYQRSSADMYPLPGGDFVDSLHLGGEGSGGIGATNQYTSSYSMYRIWLASLSLHCGWEVECDTLRIPSTRNWAIVGRRRSTLIGDDQALRHAEEIVQKVKERALFRPRKPEGRAHDSH